MHNWIDRLKHHQDQATPLVLVSLLSTKGSAPRDANAKMLVFNGGQIEGTIGGGALEKEAISLAEECLAQNRSCKREIHLKEDLGMVCGGKVELYFEVIQAPPRLSIYGGGHVGLALCECLSGTAFSVDLVDPRAGWPGARSLPPGVRHHAMAWESYFAQTAMGPEHYHCILTFSHLEDLKVLRLCLAQDWAYLGVIGSKAKWAEVKGRLLEEGLPAPLLEQVRCPMGNKKLGKSPKEIALGIACELLSLYHERQSR